MRSHSIRAAAALLGVSRRTLRRLIARGELPAHRAGRGLRVTDAAIDAYRAARSVPSHPGTQSALRAALRAAYDRWTQERRPA